MAFQMPSSLVVPLERTWVVGFLLCDEEEGEIQGIHKGTIPIEIARLTWHTKAESNLILQSLQRIVSHFISGSDYFECVPPYVPLTSGSYRIPLTLSASLQSLAQTIYTSWNLCGSVEVKYDPGLCVNDEHLAQLLCNSHEILSLHRLVIYEVSFSVRRIQPMIAVWNWSTQICQVPMGWLLEAMSPIVKPYVQWEILTKPGVFPYQLSTFCVL